MPSDTQAENFNNIPSELKRLKQWGVSYTDPRTGELNKRPYAIALDGDKVTGFVPLAVNKPEGWMPYEYAEYIVKNTTDPLLAPFTHLGFLLTDDDPYIVVDFDKHDLDATPKTIADAQQLRHDILSFFSRVGYLERSTSGMGYHLWLKNDICRGRRGARDSKYKVEVYAKERYMLMTGDWQPTPEKPDTVIHEIETPYAHALWSIIREHDVLTETEIQDFSRTTDKTQDQLLARAAEMENGQDFLELWNKTSNVDSDDDFKLLERCIFVCERDIDAALTMFMRSPMISQSGRIAEKEKKIGGKDFLEYYIKRQTLPRLIARIKAGEEGKKQEYADRAKAIREGFVRDYISEVIAKHIDDTSKVLASEVPNSELPIVASDDEIILALEQPEETPPPVHIIHELAYEIYRRGKSPLFDYALATALTVFSSLIGRNYRDDQLPLNLYTIILGKSGIGKSILSSEYSNIRKTIDKHPDTILYPGTKNGYLSHGTMAEFTSKEGLRNVVLTHKGRAVWIAEDVQQNFIMWAKQDDATIKVINGMFRQRILDPAQKASGIDENFVSVEFPSLVIGFDAVLSRFVSIANEYRDSVVGNGLIGRFLVIPRTDRPTEEQMDYHKEHIYTNAPYPIELITKLVRISNAMFKMENPMPGSTSVTEDGRGKEPILVQFSDEAEKLCDVYFKHQLSMLDANEAFSELHTRAVEKARKVAGILAVAEVFQYALNEEDGYDRPVVTKDLMQWALSYVFDAQRQLHGILTDRTVGTTDTSRRHYLVKTIAKHWASVEANNTFNAGHIPPFGDWSSVNRLCARVVRSDKARQIGLFSRIQLSKYLKDKLKKGEATPFQETGPIGSDIKIDKAIQALQRDGLIRRPSDEERIEIDGSLKNNGTAKSWESQDFYACDVDAILREAEIKNRNEFINKMIVSRRDKQKRKMDRQNKRLDRLGRSP